MRILIAEDDPVNYTILGKLLKKYGEIKIVTNGLSALNAYAKAMKENAPYDILFLDIMMPEMDGHQVLKTIREKERQLGIYNQEDQLKIIMATSVDEHDSIMQSLKNGCIHYFLKPYNPELLDDLMETMGYEKVS